MQKDLFSGNTVRVLNEENVLSVSELSGILKTTVEQNFVDLKVQGEVSSLKYHTSGHTYFSLKDNDSVINAICWRGTKLSFALEEGVEIVAKGRVTVYPQRSQYQFIVEEASVAGEGALLRLLNEKRKKFQIMGYFNKKRALPKYPQIIGIVTSKTGAVLQDMLHRLRDRYQFCSVIIWDVNVQGSSAAEQISNAVRGFNLMTEKKPDILIVARGGGSIEDLWPFNEELVVKAVYDSSIPVISAIGHETDTTLIDYAADLRAPTPTAAIELCTPIISDIAIMVSEYGLKLQNSMSRLLTENKNCIKMISKFMQSSKFSVIALTQRFDDLSENFTRAIKHFFELQQFRLEKQKIGKLNQYTEIKRQLYTSKAVYFKTLSQGYLLKYNDNINTLSARLKQSSYLKILEKGFCFMTDNIGNTIKTKSDFVSKNRNEITVHFYDGAASL